MSRNDLLNRFPPTPPASPAPRLPARTAGELLTSDPHIDGLRALIDALDGAERHEDAPPRRKKAPRCGEKAGHDPALRLDAEIRGASDFAVGRFDAIADDFRAAARELVQLRKPAKIQRAVSAPFGLPALC